ncbi:MAG: DUF507 family protein [Acidobacteria bacterium]|nr:DUF507 family protein [Acidobacteriota bacterium]
MRLQREFVAYIAQQLAGQLRAREMIETPTPEQVTAIFRQALLDELSVEDRINEKVREIMNQYADEIRRSGASYQEMYKRIKSELVRKEKVIL